MIIKNNNLKSDRVGSWQKKLKKKTITITIIKGN